MFYGRYTQNLDNKYRVRIPARLKTEFGADVSSISKGKNGCLVIYPSSTIKTIGERMNSLGVPKAVHDQLLIFMSNIYPIDEDSQGRFTINQTLRSYAGISKEVVFIGFNDRIYVWDKARWEEFESNNRTNEAGEEPDLSAYGI